MKHIRRLTVGLLWVVCGLLAVGSFVGLIFGISYFFVQGPDPARAVVGGALFVAFCYMIGFIVTKDR